MCKDCALHDRSMKFCTQLEDTIRMIFGYRDIADQSREKKWLPFSSKWPPMVVIIMEAVHISGSTALNHDKKSYLEMGRGRGSGVRLQSVHSPPQEQRAVHCRAAFLHLHRPLQSFLQPQRISCLQACVASGKVVQYTSQPLSIFFQPHSLGDGSSGAAIIIWAQQ